MAPDRLHVETYGRPDGEPVLAIHGITGFGARFGRLAGLLDERRWICPDLRGHGRSPSVPPWRTEDHLADLLAVLDHVAVDRVDVVAHSFGGHLALHLLAAAPERVGRVVLLDPATVIDPERAELRALAYARDPGWGSEQEARAEITTWFPTPASRPDLDLEVAHNLVRDGDGRWRMGFSPLVIVAAYGEMCRPLPIVRSAPEVLLVEADARQTSVSERLRTALQDSFGAGLRRVVVPESSHVLFRTHPDESAHAVGTFLRAVDLPDR
jgi:lipase